MPTDEKPSRNEEEYFGKKNLEIIHGAPSSPPV
jgi:hypothetical protein